MVKSGIEIWYSLRLRGVKTAKTWLVSLGMRVASFGSKLTSFLYLSGTFQQYLTGMRESFLIGNFYFVETPT